MKLCRAPKGALILLKNNIYLIVNNKENWTVVNVD